MTTIKFGSLLKILKSICWWMPLDSPSWMKQEDSKWDRLSKLCMHLTSIEALLLTLSTILLIQLMRTINIFPTSAELSQEILWAATTNLLVRTKGKIFTSRAICFLWKRFQTFMRIPFIRCFYLSTTIVKVLLVSNSCHSWRTRRSKTSSSTPYSIWWEIRSILPISLLVASNSTKKSSTGKRLKSIKAIKSMKLSISLKEFFLSFNRSKTTVSIKTIAFYSIKLVTKDFLVLLLRRIPKINRLRPIFQSTNSLK